ncbi:hypothetical protein D3C71_1232160 [compost metagenome]
MLHPARRGAEQSRIQTIGLADDGRQIAEVGQVHLTVGERLVDHRACALEEAPLNLDALIGESLFEDLLITQHIHDTATTVLGTGTQVRHGDADFLEFTSVGRESQQTRQGRCGEQTDDTFEGKVHGCGSLRQRALRSRK